MFKYKSVFRFLIAFGLVLILGVFVAPSVVQAKSCAWDGSTGMWSDSNHWVGCDKEVPAEGDTAIINSGNVSITGGVTVQTLSFSGGIIQGAGALEVTSEMDWSGCAVLVGDPQSANNATITIPTLASLNLVTGWGDCYGWSQDVPIMDRRTLDVGGTAVETGTNRLNLQNTSIVTINGLFDIQDDAGFTGSGHVNNLGTLRKSGGTGTSRVDGVDFNNTGTTQAQIGMLSLNGGGTSSGSFTASSGAKIYFGGGSHTIILASNSSIGGDGLIGVSFGTATISGTGKYNPGTTAMSWGTLNLNMDGTTGTLDLSGGTLQGTGTLTVNSQMDWSGCSTLAGSGTTILTQATTATITTGWTGCNGYTENVPILDARALNLAGTTALKGTNKLVMQNGAIITNSGTFDIQDDAGISQASAPATRINNSGTFRKSAGTSTSIVDSVLFNNSGTAQAKAGTLSFNGGGISSGSFSADAGATLNFGNYTQTITLANTSSFSGTGTIGFSGGTTVISGSGSYNPGGTVVNGGTLTLNKDGTTGILTVNGGTLGGSGTLTVTSKMDWSWCSALAGTGATTVAQGATATITTGWTQCGSWTVSVPYMDGRTLNLAGTTAFKGTNSLRLTDGATIANSGTFNIQDDGGISQDWGATGKINNSGTFSKSGGTGTSKMDGVLLDNTGTVQAQVGTLSLNGGGTSTGSFSAGANATLNFGGGTQAVTLGKNNSFGGSGTIGFSGGTTTVSGSGSYAPGGTTVSGGTLNLNVDGTTGSLTEYNGSLQGSGTLTVTTLMDWSWCSFQAGTGTTTLAKDATATITTGWTQCGSWTTSVPTLDTRTLNLAGTTAFKGTDTLVFQNGATLANSGTFDVQDNGRISGSGHVNNSGTLRKSGGSGTSTLDITFTNTGTVQAQSGTLNFTHFTQNSGITMLNGGALAESYDVLTFNGGTLQGAGLISGSVANVGGTVSPGNSPGVLHISGSYSQGPAGSLNIELGGSTSGTGYDLLDVTGSATLNGTLNVSLINGYRPVKGDVFRILNFSSLSGDFTTKNGLKPGWGMVLTPTYATDNLSLTTDVHIKIYVPFVARH